jgi:flavodoxin
VKKTVLIVTDGAESTKKMAETIEAALGDYEVTSVRADDFEGTQLLPADICFFGAETPNPSSFSYLYKMLNHINLSGRPCGIFSNSEKALEYLSGMVRDSELALHPSPFPGKGDIKAWTEKVAGLANPVK